MKIKIILLILLLWSCNNKVEPNYIGEYHGYSVNTHIEPIYMVINVELINNKYVFTQNLLGRIYDIDVKKINKNTYKNNDITITFISNNIIKLELKNKTIFYLKK